MDLLVSTSMVAAFIAGVAALFAPCCITVLLPSYLGSIFRERTKVFLMTFIAKGYIGFSIFYTLGLPTAAAAFSLKVSIEDKRSLSFLINVIVPIVCMVLFAMHNVGSEAVMYSFYWFIPMVIHFINGLLNARFSKYFLSALASTFVAHALGSIVYLYVMNTTPVIWNALIPVVAMERLAFSSVIVVTYFVIEFLISKIFSYNKSFQKIVIR